MKQSQYLFILLLITCLRQLALAQSGVDEAAFRSMSPQERYRFVQGYGFDELDSAVVAPVFAMPLAEIAQDKKDYRSLFALKYHYFQSRKKLRLSQQAVFALLSEMKEMAEEHGTEVEKVVAHHFVIFEDYDQKKIPHEQMYVSILQEYERMATVGFEKFKDYNIARMLYHSSRFMYELEDFEKAMLYLTTAERFLVPQGRQLQTSYLVLNHIQSIYQQQKEYIKGIEYGKKILELSNTAQAAAMSTAEQSRWGKEWQGIASIDIASMLVGQGKFAEGESYADKGYELVKATDESGMLAEYDALQVLVPTKLELGKLDEAAQLLRRMDEIYKTVGSDEYFYFKNLRFFEPYAKYHEIKGDYAAAVRYSNLAKPIRDSLERRNDARKLERIKQRLDAEKYTEKLRMVESEKQLQKWLRNAALVILLLVIALAYGNYKRLQHKRRQALVELEAAQNELATFTKGFREKSELVDNLRLELEKLSQSGERSEYLERLTKSTILTEDDWQQFRNVFEKVHPDFIAQLKVQYPDLTPAETRLLVLEKLDLNLQEMANMLGVSKNTIHQTRYRLRRKMEASTNG